MGIQDEKSRTGTPGTTPLPPRNQPIVPEEYNEDYTGPAPQNLRNNPAAPSQPAQPAQPVRPPQPAPAAPRGGAHAAASDNAAQKKISRNILIAIGAAFGAMLIIVLGAFFVIRGALGDNNTRETQFVEQPTELIKQGEIIQINDPSLGLIEIEAVEGVPKNNYDKNNFKYDENGLRAYYIDGKKASCTGIDLSEYQGDIDFDRVKASGVDYVILRIGGRYYSEEGKLYEDEAFLNNYRAAKDAGLDVGAYFFSQAASVEDAEEEAQFCNDRLKGLDLDYPVAFDWEIIADDEARTDAVTGEELTDIAIAFCDTIKSGGNNAIIYTNTSLMYYRYDLTRLKNYEFWVADYGNFPTMYYGFTMWQYAIDGTIDGVDGSVDLNMCFKNY